MNKKILSNRYLSVDVLSQRYLSVDGLLWTFLNTFLKILLQVNLNAFREISITYLNEKRNRAGTRKKNSQLLFMTPLDFKLSSVAFWCVARCYRNSINFFYLHTSFCFLFATPFCLFFNLIFSFCIINDGPSTLVFFSGYN